jgi:putative endonuclease
MNDGRMQRGVIAEDLAAVYLQLRGLKILARNLRCKAGELDLVCRQGSVLVIVEVRQRLRDDYGGALGSVNFSKQRKIIRAARFLLEQRAMLRACALRFDVIAVQGSPQGAHHIRWIKDAFRVA